ncbi:MAG: Fur family transcriptional regulator [Thermodesulfobacteriota bacterium]
MCQECDYVELLSKGGLESTPNRLTILKIVGGSARPLTAREVLKALRRLRDINRVTVYRILELLVEKRLLDRISAGDRSFRYGLAPNDLHQPHPHFYCTRCGQMECLNPQILGFDVEPLRRDFPGSIEKIQIRLDGLCRDCLEERGVLPS